MCGEPQKPTPFMCLILKMLQIQPDKDIVVEFIKNDDFKYLRLLGGWWVLRWHGRHRRAHVLLGCCADVSMLWCRLLSYHHCPDLCLARRAGAFYMRLVGRSQDVYQYLEPLYNDYSKVRVRNLAGRQELTHVDEVSDGAGRGVGAGRGEGLGGWGEGWLTGWGAACRAGGGGGSCREKAWVPQAVTAGRCCWLAGPVRLFAISPPASDASPPWPCCSLSFLLSSPAPAAD